MIQHLDPWTFINGAYAVSALFLAGASLLAWRRLRRASAHLTQAEGL
ncbi:hypothetical protein [Acidocella sp.]|nr:hypothetical protein [Acidocella sp.]